MAYWIGFGGGSSIWNLSTWSVLPMTIFVLLFPVIDGRLRCRSSFVLITTIIGCCVLSCAMIIPAAFLGLFWRTYAVTGFVYWCPCFVSGVAAAHLYRRNHDTRDLRQWGRITDLMSAGLVVVLLASYFNPCHLVGTDSMALPIIRWAVHPFDKPVGTGLSCVSGEFSAMEIDREATNGYAFWSPRHACCPSLSLSLTLCFV